MKRILTYIFGLIIMTAPFAPSTAATNTPTVVRTPAPDQTAQTTVKVTGTVLGENAEPLIGANVIVDGTNNGAATGLDGFFEITIKTDPNNATLVISYLDYKTQTIKLSDYTPTDNKINLDTITLEADTTKIDDVTIDETGSGYTICNDTDNTLIGTQHNKKCAPCACKPGYLLTGKLMAPASYAIEYISSSGATLSTNRLTATSENNNICPEITSYKQSYKGDNGGVRGGLSAIFEQTKNFQCIKRDKCHDSDEVGVEKSEYVLTNNKYTCQKTCHNGYTLNTSRNICESDNDCTKNLDKTKYQNAATGKYVGTGGDRKCVPSSCKCGFDLINANSESAKCTDWNPETCSNRTKIPGATSMKRFCSGETEICHAKSCGDGYELVSVTGHNYKLPRDISSLQTCQSHERKCTDEERKRYATHHKLTEWDTNIIKKETAINFNKAGARICIPTKCECGYDLKDEGTKDAKCEKWPENERCKQKPEHATEYYRDCKKGTEYCHITACEGDYKPNNSNDACVGKRGECKPTNATAKHLDQIWDSKYKTVKGVRKCVITKCATGYEPNEDGSDCTPLMVLPEKESQDRIDELRTVYDAAHKNETSIANKTLGAASMAATGAGGMMLASGLTEQNADKEAEEKMRGYVATFKCNYGNTNVEYGVEPTELPMSTELYNLYAEYVTLANDLKLRKEMLGLRAGIESEKILDSATTGLYDDVSSGRSAGMYTSLARAILDPNGADAAAWAEQTKKSKNLIIAGATTAGVGVVGSIVGNQLINKDKINLSKVKEDIKEINERYETFKKEFGKAASNLGATIITPQKPATANTLLRCPFDSVGTRPNCICKDGKSYDNMQNRCYFANCPLTATGTPPTCTCRNQSERYDSTTNTCVSNNAGTTTTPCPQDAKGTYPKCTCNDESKTYNPTSNTCIKTETNDTHVAPESNDTEIIDISIPSSMMFEVNSADVKEDAKNKLKQLMAAFTYLQGDSNRLGAIKITVTGYTDPNGGDKINNLLSTNRAEAVRQILKNTADDKGLTTDITAEGKGSADCTCSAGLPAPTEADYDDQVDTRMTEYPQCKNTDGSFNKNKKFTGKDVFAPCRRVEIKFERPAVDKNVLENLGIDTNQTISMNALLDAVERIELQQQ